MGDLSILNSHEFVMLSGDKLVTDSRRVAKHFGKKHFHVMRDIRRVLKQVSPEFAKSNFGLSHEINGLAGGKREPYYTMTKDGFMFLAMGFNGKKAAAIKEAYINAFNQMVDALQQRDMSLWQQLQAQIAKEVSSQVRASFGSHLMLSRKREIPLLKSERERLEMEMQPSLFLN